jgi:hypothetical protein
MVHASISTAAGAWLHAASCGLKAATMSSATIPMNEGAGLNSPKYRGWPVWTIPSVRSATTRSITTPASVAVSTPTASSWRRMASRSARTATGRRAIPAAWSTMEPATYSRIRRCSSGLGSKMAIASSHHAARSFDS